MLEQSFPSEHIPRLQEDPAAEGEANQAFSAVTAPTFDLLLGPPGVARHAGHADVVPVDVLEEHLGVPPGQGAGLGKTPPPQKESLKISKESKGDQESSCLYCKEKFSFWEDENFS